MSKKDKKLSVKALIVTDGVDLNAVTPFLSFVKGLQEHDTATAASVESQRLSPYFIGKHKYLEEVARGSAEEETYPRGIFSRGFLRKIFGAVAAYTHNVILSDVFILPDNIKEGPAGHLFNDPRFGYDYDYLGRPFDFGFLQVKQNAVAGKPEGSTTIGTFTLDHEMMSLAMEHGGSTLLRDFQEMITLVNHDPMHHYTSIVFKTEVSGDFAASQKTPLHAWGEKNDIHNDDLYEDWAQLAHAKIVMAEAGEEAINGSVRKKLNGYFKTLAQLGKVLSADDPRKAHEAVDYFGIVMGHCLMRLFPLDHPIMSHWLDLMEKTDSMPEVALQDTLKLHESLIGKSGGLEDMCAKIKDTAFFKVYREQRGFDMLPGNVADYRNLKMAALVKLSERDVQSHFPALARDDNYMRKIGRMTMDMISAAVKTTGLKIG